MVKYCPECKVYWYYTSNKEIEVRLTVFEPIEVMKCPYCDGSSSYPPTARLLDFRKVAQKVLTIEEYHKKWKEVIEE